MPLAVSRAAILGRRWRFPRDVDELVIARVVRSWDQRRWGEAMLCSFARQVATSRTVPDCGVQSVAVHSMTWWLNIARKALVHRA